MIHVSGGLQLMDWYESNSDIWVRLGETRCASPGSEKVAHLTRRQIATIVWVSLGHSPTVREGASKQGNLKHRFFFLYINNITVFFNYLYSLHFTCVHILRADASPRRQEGNPPSTDFEIPTWTCKEMHLCSAPRVWGFRRLVRQHGPRSKPLDHIQWSVHVSSTSDPRQFHDWSTSVPRPGKPSGDPATASLIIS